MSERSPDQIRELLDSLYRVDSGRILATLIRLLGDFDFAEEAMSDADRRVVGTWRIGKLLPGAFSPCRYVPQAWQDI